MTIDAPPPEPMAAAQGEDAAPPSEPPAATPGWAGWASATATCIRFYSRLPVPALPGESDIHSIPDFRTVPRALPIAALIITLPAALVLLGTGLAGVTPLFAASLAIAVAVVTTGALHEDGLADSADGLFGGATPERRLEIMKDSRVGSYGALSLGLSVLLRASALAGLMEAAGPWAAAGALLAAAIWSRAEGVRLLAAEPPARRSGASAAVGQPSAMTTAIAFSLSLALALGLAWTAGLPLPGLLLGLGLSHLAARWLARLARERIGGQTGDIVGATQQISEITIYFGLALMLRPGA